MASELDGGLQGEGHGGIDAPVESSNHCYVVPCAEMAGGER